MSFSKSKSAGYLANHMARLFARGLQKRIAPLGLAPAQFMVLLELWRKDAQTQVELISSLDVEQATMANTLKRMERDGLIGFRLNKQDRRSKLVCLTDKAHGLQSQASTLAMLQNRAALADLSASEKDQLNDLMLRVIATMKRH